MFAPRRTTAARRGAPLLAGLAVGAVVIGAAAAVTPEDSTAPALSAALGAPLPATPPAAVPAPPRPSTPGRPQLTVPAPAALPPAAPTTTPAAPVEEPAEEAPEEEADESGAESAPETSEAPPSEPSRPDRDDEPERPQRVASGPVDGVVEATNAERADAGCDDLRVDLRLAAAAQGHAEDMAENDYFSHVSQDGRTFDERIRAEGHPSPGGENIAAGQETAEAVVAAWMDSPGHRRNILDCSFTSIGVGYEPDGDYWVQNFGR